MMEAVANAEERAEKAEGLMSDLKRKIVIQTEDNRRLESQMDQLKVIQCESDREKLQIEAKLREVEFKHEESPNLQCQLFLKEELSDPIEVLDIEVTNRRPHSFVFENLTPNTWYQAIFTSVQGPPAIATFKTKIADEEMETFKILALSCDRHSRLLMGKSYINQIHSFTHIPIINV